MCTGFACFFTSMAVCFAVLTNALQLASFAGVARKLVSLQDCTDHLNAKAHSTYHALLLYFPRFRLLCIVVAGGLG